MRARPMPGVSRSGILILLLSLTASACSSPAAESTSTVTSAVTTSTAAETTTTLAPAPGTMATPTVAPRPVAEIPTFADDDELIEPDAGFTMGTLSNGLVYYIRANDRPGERAELHLAVRAGSAQEGPDQSGAAHYVEHMLFNGTEKYPENDLIRVLQGFGAEFGADINAYTNWEETVYQLTLPTDDDELLPIGLDVLREWATAATIDPDEVDRERGVLLEEWRLRSQSFTGRYFDGVAEILLAGTPYEGQNTLAGPDVLDTTTPEALRAFYDDWYRPDNMAVVAVGDFDVLEVEDLIIDIFGSVPARPGPGHPDLFTEAATEPAFFIMADPEFQQAFVELNYAMPSLPLGTIGTLRQQMAFDLAWGMIVTRLEEDAFSGNTAFFSPAHAANPLVRTQRSPGIAALGDPGELAVTAEALLTEVERVLIHGFSQEELDRATEEAHSVIDLVFDRSGTTQDATYAARYVEHYLQNAPVESAIRSATLKRRLLDEMTLEQVTATFRANIQSTEPFVIVVGPEDDAADLPTEDDLLGILTQVRTSNLDPRTDAVEAIEQLMDRPELTDVLDVSTLSGTSLEVATLGNGALVILLPTTIVENVVMVGATSFGGWSLLPEDDAAEAWLISEVITRSGVAGFNQLSLERYLSDRVVFVSPFVDETSEGFFGQAATDEIETLFQLIHLYVTEPRADAIGLGMVMDETRPFAEDPTSNPQLALSIEMASIQFGDDPRFLPLPSVEDLDTFDLDRGLEIFNERFADFSNFVVVVSGDFDPDIIGDLAVRYLGSLPSTDSGETYADVRIDRPAGVVERIVEAGSGEFGELSLLWDTPLTLDPVTRVEADLLELVIRQRLTERIREELSATYAPATSLYIVDDPTPSLELSISISADPADLDAIAAEVIADLTDLRENGPTAEEMAIAQEQLTRELELFSNEGLIDLLTFYLLRPLEDPGDVALAPGRVADATVGDLKAIAQVLISLDDYIQIQLVPEDSAG